METNFFLYYLTIFSNIFFFINSFVLNIIWAKRFDLIRFFGISYLVPVLNQVKIIYLPGFLFRTGTKSSENDRFCPIFVFCTGTKTSEKNGKKVEKKVFLLIYPGLKSEFLRPKTFLKNLIYAFKTPVK
jgi:hypothetical protein